MKSFKEYKQKDEAALVMADREIVKTILNEVEKRISTMLDKNPEKALILINQIGRVVGFGVTKKGQAKGRSFRYDLKKR
tara:strand:+ start:1668 stop:1904 length:237 start_codon:yes stop_codon:yes gene_type:complete